MEKTINMEELEQMRQQIQELKKQVNDQTRVNEDMLFKSLVDITNRIRFRTIGTVIAGIFAVFIWIGLYYNSDLDFSKELLIGTCIMLFFYIFITLRYNYWQTPMRGQNMVEMVNTLVEQKKWRQRARIVALSLLVGWLVWLYIELSKSEMGSEILMYCLGGIVVGGTIGLIKYHKMEKDYNELLHNAKKLSVEEMEE